MKKHLLSLLFVLFLTHSAFSQETENLKIVWPEEYKWKVGSNQEDGQIHMIELIPEKESLEKWTLMGNMMSIKGGQNLPVENVMNMIYAKAKENSDNAKFTVVEKSPGDVKNPWILFKIEAASFHDDKNPESQLYYITTGKTALYSNFIAVKEAKLKDKFVEKWVKVFKTSEFVYQ